MRTRRNKFQIAEDARLADRIANLQKLIADPQTSPADKEKYHRQLSATRARATRIRREREDKARQRKIEAIQERQAKIKANTSTDAPADHPERTPEEIAALPASLREMFYGIPVEPEPTPVEIELQALPAAEPEPEPQPRRSSFDPLLPEPQDAEKALQWGHRLMMSWNGTAVFYQLPSGQIVNAEGFPFLGRMAVIAGRRMLHDGTPAALYSVTEDPIPGAVFWHGAYFAPEHKQHVLEALNKSWQLPALAPDDTDPFPSIALTHEEAALNQEIRAEEIRYALRPEAAYGY